MANTFYRIVKREYLNGNRKVPVDVWYGPICYGDMTQCAYPDPLVINSYQELIEAVRKNKDKKSNIFKDLSIYDFFGHKTVYSASLELEDWSGKISRKKFKSYIVEFTVEEVNPTLEKIIKEVGINEVLAFLNDKFIK